MAQTASLARRIDAEFSALGDKLEKGRADYLRAYQERQQRLARFAEVLDKLSEVWKPQLDVLVAKFGDRVKVTPRLTPSKREATFEFRSELAQIRLRLSATTDRDVTQVVLNYDLEIVPVLMQFESHAERAFPIDAVSPEAVGQWVEDRLVSFVKTYLLLHENDYYLRDQMVQDPVAGVRFPKFAAGATLERDGQTYYFVSEETRREFEEQHGTAPK
jgi:YHS domain-containing protein